MVRNLIINRNLVNYTCLHFIARDPKQRLRLSKQMLAKFFCGLRRFAVTEKLTILWFFARFLSVFHAGKYSSGSLANEVSGGLSQFYTRFKLGVAD